MLSLITPTRGRPQAFKLLERWISRQTYDCPIEWVVPVDGEFTGYSFTMHQRLVRPREPLTRPHRFLDNMESGLNLCGGDIIAFIDDDDYYHPSYLETLLHAFDDPTVDVAGFAPSTYYQVTTQKWRCMGNRKHCSLGQTAIRRRVLPEVMKIIDAGHVLIDMKLWYLPGLCKKVLVNSRPDGRLYHLGMKCMPGAKGISSGHAADVPGQPDPEGKQLRAFLGDDAVAYREFMGTK